MQIICSARKLVMLLVWMVCQLILQPLVATPIPTHLPSLTLTQRQVCDLELLFNGGFYPLESFLGSEDYDSVVHEMRLSNGTLWPIPITLDAHEKDVCSLKVGSKVILRNQEGVTLAILSITEIWKPNKSIEAEFVYGTQSLEHPGVEYILRQTGEYYIAGKLEKIATPIHNHFFHLYKTPAELKQLFQEKGKNHVVGFQTRNPMHRAHLELTQRAAQSVGIGAHLLVHPAVGMTKPGDVDSFTRIKCYQQIMKHFPEDSATLSLLPIAMRMAGPREAVWHAIIRKNYGCTHFIVGRDHAGPGSDSQGREFYSPYAAQKLAKSFAEEIGIEILPFNELVYVQEDNAYVPTDQIGLNKTVLRISGTQLRKMLKEGSEIPNWFSFPEIVTELRKAYPPKSKQGITLFFTGLSGSGKSTLANALTNQLMEIQDRKISILDGDMLRGTPISAGLQFTKEHRSLHVRRVGFIANEITKHGGLSICALIAPYTEDRQHIRDMISASGKYIEIYVSTPLEECEKRDPKGLYARARAGLIENFTGISDPYEAPQTPEITIDTRSLDVKQAVDVIVTYLKNQEYIL